MIDSKGLTAVPGFKYAAFSFSGATKKNLGLLFSDVKDTKGTAVYTTSDIKAASVIVSREMDAKSIYKRAILINSGVANAFTGQSGIDIARSCISTVSRSLGIKPEECYMGSTGVIGKKIDPTIINCIETLATKLSENDSKSFIEATMTTDTKIKQANISFQLGYKTVNIAACAKGSGMIMPNMATMLCCVITDVSIDHDILHLSLKESIENTFNCISVDGDTSTNDSIFVLANGLANNDTISDTASHEYNIFRSNLIELLGHMAKEIVNDGEGITKFITIEVTGSPKREIAKTIAMSIANSPLVKTAIFGEDLNWGRILMAIGKARTGLDFGRIDLAINGHSIVKAGDFNQDEFAYADAKSSLKNREVFLTIHLDQGDSGITVWTCDFSYDYVRINAEYAT